MANLLKKFERKINSAAVIRTGKLQGERSSCYQGLKGEKDFPGKGGEYPNNPT